MANFFYNSTGSATAPYDTWAKAATSFATVAAAMAAGDTLFVGDNSNESVAAAITATFPGTAASPNFIYCADHTVATPGTGDLKTGAAGAGSVTTTGNNAISINGTVYCYGVFFSCGDSTNAPILTTASASYQKFENCTFKLGGTSGASTISIGNAAEFVNCTFTLSAAGQAINLRNKSYIRGGSLTGTAPTILFSPSSASVADIHGFDFSNLGNHTCINNNTTGTLNYWFVNCKEPVTFTRVAALTGGLNNVEANFVNTDSSGNNYQGYKYNYAGTQSVETTIIRTGGAQQPNGTGISNKIVTTANSKFELPFRSLPLAVWNPTTGGNVTVTVHAVSGAAGFPNNDDIWLEVEYLGSGATPLGSVATNTKNNNLATGSAYVGDSASWGGSPSGTPFAMSVTLGTSPIVGTNGATTSPQPGMAGVVLVYVCTGKASNTYYVDPLPVLS